MENEMSCDHNLLVDVLGEGEEIARQLEALLDEHSASEQCKSWAQKVRSKIRAAISMATEGSHPLACPNNTGSDSPRSNSESPRSENSDRVFKDQERREISKKRKTLPKWTKQVRVSSGAGYDVPLDDGYSWRKYGQKDILGAKYPRGYYRCTHRHAQGCLATKQVQRSDEDPTSFDVTYRGDHTCQQRTHVAPVQQNQQNPPPPDKDDQQLLSSFRRGLQVKTEGLGSEDQDPASTSFSFPSTPVSCTKPEAHHHEFSSSFALDHHHHHHHHLMDSFSPTFFPPTTADSTYFSVSQCPMSGGYAGGQSDLANIVSAATSAANSPTVDMDFLLDQFSTNFPFDNPNFFT